MSASLAWALRGVGIGWRREIESFIESRHDLTFVEVVAEYVYWWGSIPKPVQALRERGVAVIPHAIDLSLGGAERPDPAALDRLARLCEAVEAPVCSEHLSFVRGSGSEGVEIGHLTPLPRTRAMLDVLVDNVQIAQRALPVPLALENVATLFEWPDPEMDEPTLIAELLERTGAPLLLDATNIHANAHNHGWDIDAYLDALPLDKVSYIHVAGGVEREGLYHDTHRHALADFSLDVVRKIRARGCEAGVMLERDDDFPPDAELAGELDAITEAMA